MTEHNKESLIDSIDAEISELETLIELQRRKVELLSKKNASLKSADGRTISEDAVSRAESDTVNKFPSFSAQKRRASRTSNPIIDPNDPLSIGEPEGSMSETDSAKDDTDVARATQATAHKMSIVEQEAAMISSIQRMSRLTTDLANERNLLAWGRTALAACRTGLAFLGVAGVTLYGSVMAQLITLSFMALASIFMVHAIARYKRIKFVLMQPEPPLFFDRLSNVPLQTLMILLFVLALATIAAQQWEN